MTRIRHLISLLAVALFFAQSAVAEESAPKIRAVQNGAEHLYADLQYVLSLTDTDEQKQWLILKDYLDVFLIGIDRTLPMRIDLVLTDEVRRYISHFPVDKKKVVIFRNENLAAIGINSKKRGKDFYKLSGNVFQGYMRWNNGYVSIAENRNEVPRNQPLPTAEVQHLLNQQYDLAAELTNESAGQEQRRQRIQNSRKEILAALKQTDKETADDFALRVKFFETQLDEAERFYVEAERIELGWKLDIDNKHGKLDIELVPLDETALAAAVQEIGEKPSDFANLKRSENSILSFRLNQPLDEMRIANFSALFNLIAATAKTDIAAAEDLSADQKTAATQIADQTAELFVSITKAGLANGFLEAHANDSGKNTLIGGFKAAEGNKLIEILKLIPQTRDGQQIDLEIDQTGDVKIHKALIAGDRHLNFKGFFGSEELYVGTSQNGIWFAVGENALTELKAAITTAANPADENANDLFLDFFAKMGPWVGLRQQRDPEAGNVKLRKLAIDAFSHGDDTLTVQLKRTENRVEGSVIAEPGILRLGGKMIADFSKENLDGGEDPAQPNGKTAEKENKTTSTK